jgi:hypothetical protein
MRGSGHGFATGRVGRALEHGSGDSVWLANTADLDSLPLTFELWLNPSSLPSSGRMGVVDLNGAFGVFIYPDGDIACKTAGESATGSAAAAAGVWTHVACIFESGTARIFVDGSAATSSSSSWGGGAGSSDFRFGGNAPSGDDFMGLIDEARYFSDVRTPAEIAAAAAR